MKKIMLTVTLVLGTFFFVNAQNPVGQVKSNSTNVSQTTVTQTPDDGFKEIKFEELNPKVQATIKTFADGYLLKSIGYKDDKKQTKVVLITKTDNSLKTVILDEEGKEVTDTTAK